MDQYLCPYCNRIVPYNGHHPCFTYPPCFVNPPMPRLEETDEKDKELDDVQDQLKENPEEISIQLCSNKQQNTDEESMHVHPTTIENKEKLSFKPASNKRKKGSSTGKNTFKKAKRRNAHGASFNPSALNVHANKEHSNGTASPSAISEYFESDSASSKEFLGPRERTSFVIGSNNDQKQNESNTSDCPQANEECGLSLEDSKWQSLNEDKDSFMNALVSSSNFALSDNENISEISNVLDNFDSLPLFVEKEIEIIVDLQDVKGNVSAEVSSEFERNTDDKGVNEDESVSIGKVDNTAAGTSKLRSSQNFYNCDICPKQFKHKSRLDEHYRTHTGEKPFECDKCGEQFTQKSNLATHYRIHTGEKPFACDICGNEFTQKEHRDVHYRTHTGETPFKCPFCGKAFSQSSNLYRHQRKKHK